MVSRQALPLGMWMLAAALVLTLPGLRVWAQAGDEGPAFPDHLYRATGEIPLEQRQPLQQWVQFQVQRLTGGNDEQISLARRSLLEPLRHPIGQGNSFFQRAYQTALLDQLPAAVSSDRVLVRINALIVLGQVQQSAVVPLLRTALTDASPAVRFLAAKAIRGMEAWAADQVLDAASQGELLSALTVAINSEQDANVFEQLLLGMATLTLPAAEQRVMEIAAQRASLFNNQPGAAIQADFEAMTRIATRYVRLQTEGGLQRRPDEALIKQLAGVASRYLLLTSTALMGRAVPSDAEAIYKAIARWSDQILRWAVQRYALAPDAQVPQNIDRELLTGSWDRVVQVGEEWVVLLSREPISLPAERLRP